MPRHLYPKLSWLMTRTKSKKLRKSLFNSLEGGTKKQKGGQGCLFCLLCLLIFELI
jgi:hypothetical protein